MCIHHSPCFYRFTLLRKFHHFMFDGLKVIYIIEHLRSNIEQIASRTKRILNYRLPFTIIMMVLSFQQVLFNCCMFHHFIHRMVARLLRKQQSQHYQISNRNSNFIQNQMHDFSCHRISILYMCVCVCLYQRELLTISFFFLHFL